jgi:hypothetical protein
MYIIIHMYMHMQVVISRAFFNFLLHKHFINTKKKYFSFSGEVKDSQTDRQRGRERERALK